MPPDPATRKMGWTVGSHGGGTVGGATCTSEEPPIRSTVTHRVPIPRDIPRMTRPAALPFLIKRGDDVFTAEGMTSTREIVHGLLRLERDQLVIQWRVGKKTEHLGSEVRTERAVEPVREIIVKPGEPIPPAPQSSPVGLGGIRVDLGEHTWPAPPEPGTSWRTDAQPLDHFLIALDGSAAAEATLPVARDWSTSANGKMTIVSVVPEYDASDEELRARAAYLDRIAQRLRESGREVGTSVIRGEPARSIVNAAELVGADAIAIASHGRSPVSEFLLGSVSRKVLQLATKPVVLVPDREAPDQGASDEPRVLVALDGSKFGERVLPYARTLAGATGAELVLLVVPEIPEAESFGIMGDSVMALREQAEAQAEHYLRGVLSALVEDGFRARGLVGGTGAARTIRQAATDQDVDMILLATHGRGGIDGLLLGNVAARVVRYGDRPVFLLPIHERREA